MKMQSIFGRFFIICIFFLSSTSEIFTKEQINSPAELFHSIEQGILQNEIDIFASYLGVQVTASIGDDQPEILSKNQAQAILQNFLHARHTIRFQFTTSRYDSDAGFATGRVVFTERGRKSNMQVYVRVMNINSKWYITQINFF